LGFDENLLHGLFSGSATAIAGKRHAEAYHSHFDAVEWLPSKRFRP